MKQSANIDTGGSLMEMFARTQPELFRIYTRVPRRLKKKTNFCVSVDGKYFVRKNKPFMLKRNYFVRKNDFIVVGSAGPGKMISSDL